MPWEEDPEGSSEKVAVIMKGEVYRSSGLKHSDHPDVESELYDILCNKKTRLMATRDEVRKTAQSIALKAKDTKFNASIAWLDDFMRRFCLSRKKTGFHSQNMLKIKGKKGVIKVKQDNKHHNSDVEPVKSPDKKAGSNSNGTDAPDRTSSGNGEVTDIQDPSENKQDEESSSEPEKTNTVDPEKDKKIEEGKVNGEAVDFEGIKGKSSKRKSRRSKFCNESNGNSNSNSMESDDIIELEDINTLSDVKSKDKSTNSKDSFEDMSNNSIMVDSLQVEGDINKHDDKNNADAVVESVSTGKDDQLKGNKEVAENHTAMSCSSPLNVNNSTIVLDSDEDDMSLAVAAANAVIDANNLVKEEGDVNEAAPPPPIHPQFMIKVRSMSELMCSPEHNKMPSPVPEKREPVKSTLMSLFRTKGKEGDEQSSEKSLASSKVNEAKSNDVAASSVKLDKSVPSKIGTKGKEIESDENEMSIKRKKDAKTRKHSELTKGGSEGEDDGTDDKETVEEDEEEEEASSSESTTESEKSLVELTGSGDSEGSIGEYAVSENSDVNDEAQHSQWEQDNVVTYTKKENKLYRRTSKELLSNVETNLLRCTACNEQVNHKMDTLVFTHPLLGVLMCKRCRKFYGKGTFKRDSDGLDEYCRWCANGGDLLLCDKCTNGFCKPCVRRNLGRSALSGIERCKEWSCYVCDMTPLVQVRLQHRAVLESIRIMRNKQQNKSRMEKKKSEMTNKFEALKMLRKSKEPIPVAATATIEAVPATATPPLASNQSAPWLETCMTDLIDMLQVCTSQVSRVQAKWGGVITDSSNDGSSTRLQCSRRLLRLMRAMTDNFEAVEKKFLMNCGEDRKELQKVLDMVATEKGTSSANRLQASADADVSEAGDVKAEENCGSLENGFSSRKCLGQPTVPESDAAVLSIMETEDNQVSGSEAADNIKSTVRTRAKRKGGEESSVPSESEEKGLELPVNVKKTNQSMKNDSEDEKTVESLGVSLRSRNKVSKPEAVEAEEEKMSKSERSRSLRCKNRSKNNELEDEKMSKSEKSRSSRSRNRSKDSESEEQISKSEKSRSSLDKKGSKDSESDEEKIVKSKKLRSSPNKKESKDCESEEGKRVKSEKSRNSRNEKSKDSESGEEAVSEATEKVRRSSRRRGRDSNAEEDEVEAATEEQDNTRGKKRKKDDKDVNDTSVKAFTPPSGTVPELDVGVPEPDAADNSELEDAEPLISKEADALSKAAGDASKAAGDASKAAGDASKEEDASKAAEDASKEEAVSDAESRAEERRRSSRMSEKVQLKYSDSDDSERVKSKKRKRKSSTTNEDKKDDSEKRKKLKRSKTKRMKDNSEDEDGDKITGKDGKRKENKLKNEGESDCDADTESDVDDTNRTKSPKKIKKKKKDKRKDATESEKEDEEVEQKNSRKSRKMPKLTDHDSDDNNKRKSKSKKKGKKKDKYDDVDSDEFERRKKAYIKRERSKLDKEKESESESDNSEKTAEDNSKEMVDEGSDAACAKEDKESDAVSAKEEKGDADPAKKDKGDTGCTKKDKEKSIKAVDKSDDSKLSRSGGKCSDEDMFASSGGEDTMAEAEPLPCDEEGLDDKEDTKGASDLDKDSDTMCKETSLFDRLKKSSKKQGDTESSDKKSHSSTKAANDAAFNDLNNESSKGSSEQIPEVGPVDQSDAMEGDDVEKNDSPVKNDKLNVKSQSADEHDQVKMKKKDDVCNGKKIKLKGSCRKTTRAKIASNEEAKTSLLSNSDSESGAAKIKSEKSISKKENKAALNDLLASDSDSDSKVTKTANDAAKEDILASDSEDDVKKKAKPRIKSVNEEVKRELLESSDSDQSKGKRCKTSKKSKMASRNESAKKDLLASDTDASITARTYKKSDKKSSKKKSKAKGKETKDSSEVEAKDSAGAETSSDISSDDLLGIGGITTDEEEEEKQNARTKKHKATPRVVQERRQQRQLKQLRPVVEVHRLAAAVEERLEENEGSISMAEYKKMVRTEKKLLKSKAKQKKGLRKGNKSGSEKDEVQDEDLDSDAEFTALMKFKLKKKLSSKSTKSEEEEEGDEDDSDDAKSGEENADKKSGDEADKDTKSKGDSKKKQKKEGLLDISLHSNDENAEDEEEDDPVKKKEVKKSDPTSTFNEKMKKTLLQSSDEEAHGSDSEDSVTRRERELLEDEKKKRYEKMKARQKEKEQKEKEAEGENDEEEGEEEEKKNENKGDDAQEVKDKPVGKKGYMSLKFSSDEEDEEKRNAGENDDEDFEEEEDDDDSDDSEYESPRKSRMFIGSDTDSDFLDTKKRSNRKKEPSSDSDESSEQDKKPRKKRIRKASSSSDEEEQAGEGNENEEVTDDTPSKRKHRRIIRDEDLTESTKNATQQEEDRRARIKERQQIYNKIFEVDVEKDQSLLKNLVLDFDSDTKKELVSVHQKLVPLLKPHQVQGIKFMWDATCESVERVKDERGSGAILAHCMGLGKTLQVIVFLHTLLTSARLQPRIQRVLVLCPVNTVYNWVSEFKKWLKGKMLPFDVIELISAKDLWNRAYRLEEWHNETGVCIIGYDMYRTLSNEKHKKYKGKMKQIFQKTLVDPGPDFVICDEGHILKNEKTALSLAVNKMKTARRVVLTGTPLQNNLKEYHCMIQFVKPNLLGTRKEFLNRFVNPITAGSCADATPRDVKRMKRRAHILHNLLEGCVQRFDYTVLKPFLPPKMEYVISVQMSDLQCKLYTYYLENLAQGGPKRLGSGLFVDFNNLSRVWTHPKVLDLQMRRAFVNDSEDEEMEDFICDDETTDTSEDDRPRKKKKSKKESEEEKSEESKPASPALDALPDGLLSNGKVRADWWKKIVSATADDDDDSGEGEWMNKIELSGKLVLLLSILRECCGIGDKVLVFSQSILALDMIEEFLALIDRGELEMPEHEDALPLQYRYWKRERDYLRLDGSVSADIRKSQCKFFNENDNDRCRLFLISTRAGGIGINLVAANRVIIFDSSWNPAHDTQSIFRVYRFGQTKPCYVYRFVAQGTMEEKIYSRQVNKLSTSLRVVDEHQIKRYFNTTELADLYEFNPADAEVRETPIVPEDRLLAELIIRYKEWIVGYHEHDSLLENQTSEELSEEERKAAWEDFENEKKGMATEFTGGRVQNFGGVQFQTTVPAFDINQVIQSIYSQNPNLSPAQLQENVVLATRQIQKIHLNHYQRVQAHIYNLKNPMIAPEIRTQLGYGQQGDVLPLLQSQLTVLEDNIRRENQVISQMQPFGTQLSNQALVSAGLTYGNPAGASTSGTAVRGVTSNVKQYVDRSKASHAAFSNVNRGGGGGQPRVSNNAPMMKAAQVANTTALQHGPKPDGSGGRKRGAEVVTLE